MRGQHKRIRDTIFWRLSFPVICKPFVFLSPCAEKRYYIAGTQAHQ